jgi:long-chain fatty acid transport protein
VAVDRSKLGLSIAPRPTLATRMVCAASVLFGSSVAGAAGFAAAEFGGVHGNVVTTDPTAIYFNPAGMALGGGTRFYLAGLAALRRGTWTHTKSAAEPSDPPGAEGADTGQARFSNLFGAPALALTTWIDRVAVGAALYAPFGGSIHWDKNRRFENDATFSGAADGVQRWHIIDGSLSSLYVTVGAAMRFGPLAIGATGNLIRSSVSNTFAKSFNPQQVVDPSSEGRAALDVSGFQASFGLGAMVEAIAGRLWFGASYQAQPGLGQMKLDGTLSLSMGADKAPPQNITFTQALPDIVRAGLRFRPIDGRHPLELRTYGELARWSRMGTQCVSTRGQPCAVFPDGSDATPRQTTIENRRRYWKDTYRADVAASYWVTEGVEIIADLGFETAATPDATLEPSLNDAQNFRIALGGRVALPYRVFLGATATTLQYATRDNTGKSTLSDAQFPTRRPDGGGQYQLSMAILQISLEKQF